jgi:hypothetical protein
MKPQERIRLTNKPRSDNPPTGFTDIVIDSGVPKYRTPEGTEHPMGGVSEDDLNGKLSKSDALWVDVVGYGAAGDAKMRVDGAISSGTAILTSATATFAASDVGKYIRVEGAGVASADLITTIQSRTNATTVVLANNAGTTVSGKSFWWGTDDTDAVQAAIDEAAASTPRKSVYFSRPAFLVNLTLPREMHLFGFNSGSALSDLTTEYHRLNDPDWACTLFPANTATPIIYIPDAFGTRIERLVFANSNAKLGEGIQLGPQSASTFGGTSIILSQLTFLGFNKAIRDRHCNEVIATGINMIDCTSGFWFGADTSAGGTGHGGVNVRGIQTIGVDYPFNTASGIGMRVTVSEGDFNYGIRLARLEILSFFNATTINVEDFTGEIVAVYDASATVDIRGITFLRSDIPTVSNYSACTSISISGDPNSKVIYRTAGSEYPVVMPPSGTILRYTATNWTTLGETEQAGLAYRLPYQQFRDREFRETWATVLDSGTHPTNNAIGVLRWTRANITGTTYVSFSGDGAGHPGTVELASGSNTTSAARWAVENPIGLINGNNYFEWDFGFLNVQPTAMKTRYGLYEKEGTADMDPSYGIGVLMDPASSTFVQLEVRVSNTSTLVATTVLCSSLSATAVRAKIVRNSLGVYLSLRNYLTGDLLGGQAFIAAAVTPPSGKVFPSIFTEMASPTSFPSIRFYGMTLRLTGPK